MRNNLSKKNEHHFRRDSRMYRWIVLLMMMVTTGSLVTAQTYQSPTRFEAENGFNSNVSTSSTYSGYSGSGYVTGLTVQNAETKFYKGANSSYPLTKLEIRYTNGSGANVTNLELLIGSNHTVQGLVFPATANWSTWGTLTVVFTHDPSWGGDMRIVSTSNTSVSVNIDYTDVSVSNGVLAAVATPTFSSGAGTYSSTQSVTISTSTSGASIYYTTDNSTPTTASSLYSGAISVATTKTIKAIGVKSGLSNSSVASAAYTIIIPTAATPSFSPADGTYSSTQTVAISSTTSGAQIRYTTNGSDPTGSSTLYSSPITVSASQTVKAIAIASGIANSAIGSASYTINIATPTAATPSFSPAGGTYSSAQTVSISTTTSGAQIRYTTDGSNPTSSSTLYSAAISVGGTQTLKAIAIASGYNNSAIGSAAYTINTGGGGAETNNITRQYWSGISGTSVASLTSNANYPNNPTSTSLLTSFQAPTNVGDNYGQRIYGYVTAPTTGSYTFWISADDGAELWLSTTTSATNRVNIASVNGWTNSLEWTKYSSQTSAAINLVAGTQYFIEAIQKEGAGGDNLAVAWQIPGGSRVIIPGSALSTSINEGTTPTVAVPTFSPAAGTYTAAQSVAISTSTSGAQIRYTTDGSTPTASSTLYSGAISVGATQTIKAIGIKAGSTNSAVATAAYTINIPSAVVSTPTFSPPGGTYSSAQSVTISTSTSGATIRYTTDGSTPTGSSTQYTSPISVTTNQTIKAIAIKSGLTNSSVATAAYTIGTTPLPPSQAGVIREVWSNVDGITIGDLTGNANYPNSPTTTSVISTIDPPRDLFDSYGQRIKGYLAPTVTGSYKFWIASDDDSELWLSTTSDPNNKVKIAYFTGWTNPETYTASGTQASANIALTAGNYYYIEALHKEGNGGDHVTVAWQVSGGNRVTIPNANLLTSPPIPLPAPGAFSQTAPASGATGVALSPTFSWGASSDAASYTLVVSTNSAFTNPVINQSGITGTSYVSGGLSGTTSYYWKVTAVNVSGTRVASNSGLSFATLTPPAPGSFTQTTPANGASSVSRNPTFAWVAASNASTYSLVISTNSSLTSPIINVTGLTSATYTHSTNLASSTLYYWRVTAVNSTGSTVSTNSGISFTTSATTGTYYYVSTTGTNIPGGGSTGSPWRTIAYAAKQVAANQNNTIYVNPGTYTETEAIIIPLGVNLEGAGEANVTVTSGGVIPPPAGIDPGYTHYHLWPEGSLIQLTSPIYNNVENPKYGSPAQMIAPTNGNQTVSGLTLDGNGKKIKAGLWVENRSNTTVHHVTFKNFDVNGAVFSRGDMWWYEPIPTGKWMMNTKGYNLTFINSSRDGVGGGSSGNLSIGGLDGADFYNITINENQGYGIKFKHVGHMRNVKIHDSNITVPESDPDWGEDISIEVWNMSYGNEIYNIVCNTWLSLVNHVQFNDYQPTTANPSNLKVRNVRMIDQDGSSGKEAIECALSGVEISECYIQDKGFGVAIWGGTGWGGSIAIHDINIHNNIFNNVNRSIQYGFGNSAAVFIPDGANTISIHNNVFDNLGNSLQLNGGSGISVKNNVFRNSGGDDVQGGSSITFTNNLRYHTDPQNQNWKSSASVNATNIKGNPGFKGTGSRWDTYYQPSSGSSLMVNAGVNVGLPFSGTPDIGRWEYGLTSSRLSQTIEDTSVNGEMALIYPNPTRDLLSIDLGNEFENAQMSIVGVTGQVFVQKRMIEGLSQISLKEIPTGIYLLILEFKGASRTFRIVKQ